MTKPKQPTTISGCTFNGTAPHTKHTATAVQALAAALTAEATASQKRAEALAELAKTLSGGNVRIDALLKMVDGGLS